MDGSGTGGAVGLVLARPRRLLSAEPFFMEFIAGIEERMAERDMSVLLHLVTGREAELAAYRRWAERRLVDAVVVVNPTEGDERPAVLRELGLPAVVAGSPVPDPATPTVLTDHVSPVRTALERLLELGHRRVARVSGPVELLHTRARTEALAEGCRAAGIPAPVVLEGDYSHEAGARLTAELLKREDPPTAVLYDNDVMAVAGLEAARGLGVRVPGQLSLVAWDDSTLCRLAEPALTTMSVDVYRYGVAVAESALECADGAAVAERWSPAARFVARGSTGPAPAGE
ncbi:MULTISPECIES: LacI family DNA-binding transcriptional regulator [Nocardiopsis]|uniref:Periplasmic binding protein/LacI transcriptional regulator n=1 Tax=Nocardiopsis dassonvillei (strain ATCC 23218 / DSM 43111 / CIP 107115 / JCM 7437 / KCTC 9190 / NBRC 14626 / NCTC 10488 / NRRL B-5397 / IMRU 509) TaxID=446468 RepID=D7B117_NOCDD|nr:MULTISPECIES: substrate-binding domain-containing protein [Nocardiopsis]ADH70211.1 periplasmic binding protein/LacI transcriptional regulator [Nocardiopsis dassonvillei subsp. dassonvillei DSM 43111]APC38176.1 LacI family transcriptional regulator [Nocardiopsis dassonvillei]NKY81162.1 LacI family transcriptional regulator [Nocardiopsis dassonvillei]VEI90730.1 HTH-type transcriptional repressor CytR [Nocardiopsis dassonvillei]